MEINFHIPDFGSHFRVNNVLINTIKSNPEYFYDGLKIASVFGTFPGSVWNGGRYLGGTAEDRSMQDIIKVFNDKGVPLRFTFTNPLIKKEHLGDNFCNKTLRYANNGFNEVIVMSPILEEYIRENYPKFPITSSTCKQIENMDDVIAELKKDYKYVVLDYNWNNRFDELEKIPPEYREKCEILVNACCDPHCKRRGEHYRHIGEQQIKAWEYEKNILNKNPYECEAFECPCMERSLYDEKELITQIYPDAIINKYVPMGFKHFKLEGRTSDDIHILETYVLYMVKPEYRDKARYEMLELLTQNIPHFR